MYDSAQPRGAAGGGLSRPSEGRADAKRALHWRRTTASDSKKRLLRIMSRPRQTPCTQPPTTPTGVCAELGSQSRSQLQPLPQSRPPTLPSRPSPFCFSAENHSHTVSPASGGVSRTIWEWDGGGKEENRVGRGKKHPSIKSLKAVHLRG